LPILQGNCVGCHGGSEPDGGYDFSTYAGVKQAVDDNRLLGAVLQLPDYSAMPPSPASKLDDCNLAKVRKWIQNGALDN
jgi:mono/diheme cytochrome c family protein